MDNNLIPPGYDSEIFIKLKDLFIKNGSTEEQLKKQINKLGQLIILALTTRLLEQKPPPVAFTSEDQAAAYIQANFSAEEIKIAYDQVSKTITTEYIQALTA